jgi:hypothetical protein
MLLLIQADDTYLKVYINKPKESAEHFTLHVCTSIDTEEPICTDVEWSDDIKNPDIDELETDFAIRFSPIAK